MSDHSEYEWITDFDLETANTKQVGAYVKERIMSYQMRDDWEEQQWFSLKEDFIGFTKEKLTGPTEPVKKLRDFLRQRGVWIPMAGRPIAQELFNCLEEGYKPWPEGEEKPEEYLEHIERKLQKKLQKDADNQNRPRSSPPQVPPQVPPKTSSQVPPQAPPQAQLSLIPQTSPIQAIASYTPGGWSKELTNLAKLYRDEYKYGGDNDDSFDYKLNVWINFCRQADIPQAGLLAALPQMLKGHALDYYFANAQKGTTSLEDICQKIRDNFEGKERTRTLLLEWNALTLQSVIAKPDNKDKKMSECLGILIQKLRIMQHGLPQALRSDEFIYSKLITACELVPACDMACKKPADTLPGLINDLRASVATEDRKLKDKEPETYYTDRRYRDQRYRDQRRDRDHGRQNRPRDHNDKKVCFICKKAGCWSTKHSKEERRRHIRQYMVELELEGTEPDESESDLNDDQSVADNLLDDVETFTLQAEDTEPLLSQSTTFTTQIGIVDGLQTAQQLAIQSALHNLTGQYQVEKPNIEKPEYLPIEQCISRYDSNQFHGIMIDTGAAFKSTAGYGQFKAYQAQCQHQCELDTNNAGQYSIKFGIGDTPSIGTTTIETPIGNISFHVVKANTPFILCLQDLTATGYYYNNLANTLVNGNEPGKSVQIVQKFGHPFMLWDQAMSAYLTTYTTIDNAVPESLLTETELRQLHRRFGHPSARRLANLLKRTPHEFDIRALEHLTKLCKQCQLHSDTPKRFKFTLKDEDDVCFNHTIIVDLFYLDDVEQKKPVLHIVDEATRFQAAHFLVNISAQHVWDVLRMIWIDVYTGPPDFIVHDAGTQFVSREFTQSASTMTIQTRCVPVEAHNAIGMVERYHKPLRRAYNIIATELKGTGIGKDMILQMAVKAINDTAGPSGITPTLLVFGTYPKLSKTDAPAVDVQTRAAAIQKAMGEIQELYAKRQVTEALRQRNGPDTIPLHLHFQDSTAEKLVLVWRERKGWKGPYRLLSIEGETCNVQLPSGPTHFRTTQCKPYLQEMQEAQEAQDEQAQEAQNEQAQRTQNEQAEDSQQAQNRQEPEPQEQTRRNPSRQRQLPAHLRGPDITLYMAETHITEKEKKNMELAKKLRSEGKLDATQPLFYASRRKEMDGLMARGVFKIVRTLPEGERLFKTRFVDEIKGSTDKPFEKSRLVVQAFNDLGKRDILTQAPTIQRVSQRIIICLAAITGQGLYVRDISQAYVQSTTELNRPFFAQAPPEMNLKDGRILHIRRPLYGIPEAGTHWFRTYHTHHVQKLGLTTSPYDPCLLYAEQQRFAVVGLQTDDTLFVADEQFVELEQAELEKAGYPAKALQSLNDGELAFNGGTIKKEGNGSITLTQERQCAKIQLADGTEDEYVRQRARGAYIASLSQPEASFDLSFAAQTVTTTDNLAMNDTPNRKDATTLNRRLKWQMANQKRGLRFIPLDMTRLKLIVFVDAAFANNADMSSQLGYIITLANEQQQEDNGNSTFEITANILHWSSTKCKRVTRSVLAAELFAMAQGFDMGSVIAKTIKTILDDSSIPLVICTDSRSLYDCLTKLGTTHEKRLMIDIMVLRQAYENRDIAEVRWIDGKDNPADALTKSTTTGALKELVDGNTLRIRTNGWVERAVGVSTISGGNDTKPK